MFRMNPSCFKVIEALHGSTSNGHHHATHNASWDEAVCVEKAGKLLAHRFPGARNEDSAAQTCILQSMNRIGGLVGLWGLLAGQNWNIPSYALLVESASWLGISRLVLSILLADERFWKLGNRDQKLNTTR